MVLVSFGAVAMQCLWDKAKESKTSDGGSCKWRRGSVVELEAAAASGKKEMHKEKKSRLSCNGDNNGGIVGDVKINKCNNNDDEHNSNNLKSESELGMMNNEVSFDGTHNFTLRLSKSNGPSALGRVFPRDEEEAAILLMELSCGLLHTC